MSTPSDLVIAAQLVKARLDHDADRAEQVVGTYAPATVINGLIEMCVHTSHEVGRHLDLPTGQVVDTIADTVTDITTHHPQLVPTATGTNRAANLRPGTHRPARR